MTEALFVFLLVVALYYFTNALDANKEKRRLLHYGLAGLAAGIATLVRPISMYLPLFVAIYLFYLYRKSLMKAVKFAGVFTIAFMMIVSLWLVRNHNLYDEYSLSYIPGWDLLALNVAMMEAPKRHQDLNTVSQSLLAEADSMMIKSGHSPHQLNLMQKAGYWKSLAVKYIVKDPIDFAYYHIKGLTFVFLNLGTADFARAFNQPLTSMESYSSFADKLKNFLSVKSAFEITVALIILPFLLISYFCLLGGLLFAWKTYRFDFLLLSLILAFYFVITPGALGLVRFKLPALPFLAIFMGIGLDYWLRKFRLV